MTRHLLLVFLAALTSGCILRREPLQGPGNPETDAFVSPQDDAPRMDAPSREDAFVPAGEDAFTPPCGGRTEPCCGGTTCEGPLVCAGGICEPCGGTGERCCEGGQCPSGVCDTSDNICRPCGAEGNRCCVGNTCIGSALGCSSVGTCDRCGGEGQACCGSGTPCEPTLNCREATCVPAAVGGCDVVGGACCRGALGDYCAGRGLGCNEGRCVSECGGLEQGCCLVGWCREGACTEIGFLNYRCR